MTDVTIRPSTEADVSAWGPLWQGYLTFYGTELPEDVTALTWHRLHEAGHPLHAFVAETSGRLVGFAHYHVHASTWSKSGYCYLEDLFVSDDARGLGVGRALIAAVRKAARTDGADRLYWHTNTGNDTARRLYDDVAELADFVQYRMPLED